MGRATTVLVSELSVPLWASEAFADGLLDWIAGSGFEEVTVLNGVPFAHGPEEHAVFSVATDEYRRRRLDDADFEPLRGGFFEGVVGELLAFSVEGTTPPTGVLVTPTHPPGPDLEGSVRFLEAVQTLYDLPVDVSGLQEEADQRRRYYAELAERIQAQETEDTRGYSEDRAYM